MKTFWAMLAILFSITSMIVAEYFSVTLAMTFYILAVPCGIAAHVNSWGCAE